MRRVVVYLTAWLAFLSAALLLFGAWMDRGERLTLRVLTERRLVTVIVGLPDLDDRYRWLSVYACSAAMLVDSPVAYCTGQWERESSMELTGRKQQLVDWRDLPGGLIQVTAMAFDADRHVLAQHTTTVFR